MKDESVFERRMKAGVQGKIRFDPGVPCKYGHESERFVSSGRCVICNRESAKRNRHEAKKQGRG